MPTSSEQAQAARRIFDLSRALRRALLPSSLSLTSSAAAAASTQCGGGSGPHETVSLCLDALERHWGCAEAVAAAARFLMAVHPACTVSAAGSSSTGSCRGVLLQGTARHLLPHVAILAAVAATAAEGGGSCGEAEEPLLLSPGPVEAMTHQLAAIVHHVVLLTPPEQHSDDGDGDADGTDGGTTGVQRPRRRRTATSTLATTTVVIPAEACDSDVVMAALQMVLAWPEAAVLLAGCLGQGRRQAQLEVRGRGRGGGGHREEEVTIVRIHKITDWIPRNRSNSVIL